MCLNGEKLLMALKDYGTDRTIGSLNTYESGIKKEIRARRYHHIIIDSFELLYIDRKFYHSKIGRGTVKSVKDFPPYSTWKK